MTRVLVALPWRPQPHREYAHDLTTQRYRELLPDALIMGIDTRHDPFCLAACRNEGVSTAETLGYDVVVLADADTLPERQPLLEAIEHARVSRFVHLPYTQYRGLGADGTKQHLAGVPLDRCSHVVIPGACSGVLVTTPATWWAAGGQDERYRGWSPEDVAFLIAHRTLLSSGFARHDGNVYALHHDSPPKTGPVYDEAVAHYQRYLDADHKPAAMRALVAENHNALTCDKSTSATGG